MKTRTVILALLLLLLTCPTGVLADSWSGHYQVGVTVTSLGVNSYNFTYAVKNLDQGGSDYQGLDGFYVQVPLSATISAITDPLPFYGDPGYWTHIFGDPNPPIGPGPIVQPGYQWLSWFGMWPQSVYPIGETVIFSFDADNVVLGEHQAFALTYWAPLSYTGYVDLIQGPAAVPLPGTLALLGPGLLGLAVFGRRRIFKK